MSKHYETDISNPVLIIKKKMERTKQQYPSNNIGTESLSATMTLVGLPDWKMQ
jgi:hypothetical protein